MSDRTERYVIWFVLVGLLILAVFPLGLQLPIPLVAVESGSMAPHLVRGDLGIVGPVLPFGPPTVGDVIVFKESDTQRWVAHRIVGGNPQSGFLTKGDNNSALDQDTPGRDRVRPAQIAGIVLSVGGRPLRIPLLGMLILHAREFVEPSLLSWAALLLGAIFVSVDVASIKRTRQQVENPWLTSWSIWLPLLVVLVLSLAQTMISNSQEGQLTYDVSLVRQSESQSLEYSMSNDGALPLVLVLYTDDENIVFSDPYVWLPPRTARSIVVSVDDDVLSQANGGRRQALFRAGTYLPLLPPSVLYTLLAWDLKGSAIVTALVPALVLVVVLVIITPKMTDRRNQVLLRRRIAG